MKEIRLTFNADDFGAVSKILVDMGIGFTVEPVKDAEADVEVAAPRATPSPSAAPKRRATRKKAKAAGRGPTKRESAPLLGADRLREALTRKPDAPEPAGSEMPDRWPDGPGNASTPPGDQAR